MVPQFRPQAALTLLHNLVTASPFAAPLDDDVAIIAMTDDQFDAYLDAWTTEAKSDL
jgi:hypothetical protein